MTWLMIILGALFCATFNEAWKGRELPPRYWAEEIEKENKDSGRQRFE